MLIREDYFKNIFNTVREGILVLDANMRVLSANRSFFNIFKVDAANTIGSLLYDLGNGQWNIPYLRVLLEDILPKNDTVDDYEIEHNFEDIGTKTMLLNASKITVNKDEAPIIILAIEDITERKEIEKGLEKARKELAATKISEDDAREYAEGIVNTVREPLIALDHDLRVVTASSSFYDVFKVSLEETVGQLIYDLGNQQWNIPKLRELLETILPEKTTFDNYEVEHEFSTIGRRTMLLNARQIEGWFGKERIILLAIEDITERKRLEDLLTESEKRYRRVFETATDCIVLLEKHEGRITHTNPAAVRMLGYSEEEFMGKMLQDIGVPLDTSDFPAIMQALDKEGIINYDDVSVKNKSGHYIHTDIYMVDRASLAQCNIREITERKQAEETLRKSEEFTKNILESVDEGFIVIDLEYRIIAANRAYLNFVGKPLEGVIGKHCYELSHHTDNPCCEEGTADCPVRLTFQTGEHYSSFHTHYDSTGTPVYVEIKSYPMKDRSGKIVSAIEIINNITEKKKLQDQLIQAQKMEAVGLLAGGIAHDFNNVLSAIVGYGYLLQTNMDDDDPLREHVDQIIVAADRATDVTHSLLAFSRKQLLNPKPININALMKRFEKLLSSLIGEDIELGTNFTDKDVISMADDGQIEQVLLNLAINSRDAMPHGGHLILETQLLELDDTFIGAHGYGESGMYAVISVTDTGIGMDKETMAKIFEPFFTTKGDAKGTGLGLAMAYGIIKQHNGYINVYSEPEKGTTFRIYLPAIKSSEEAFVKNAIEALPSRGHETILIAEDDGALRELFSIVLRAYGYKVILAKDGAQAIKRFMHYRDKIQLVMLDMIMPKKSGKEVFDIIRTIRPDMKTIFSSGYTADRIDKDSMLKGGFDLIIKPISPKVLLKKIREVLDK